MLRFPEKARKAVANFFRRWNSLDVFVEDVKPETEKVYITLINQMAADLKVERIFPLGGRKNVLDECKKDQTAGGRPRLYVIDGDLALLTDDTPPKYTRLFIHPVYCIENYLINESALAGLLNEEIAGKSLAQIKNDLKFKDWAAHVGELLGYLFITFALMKQYVPTETSVGLGASHFRRKGHASELDPIVIYEFVGEVYGRLCEQFGHEEILCSMLEIHDRFWAKNNPLSFISGKDFLIPCLRWHIQTMIKPQPTKEAFVIRLAGKCPSGTIKEFRKAVLNSR